ncbi:transposase, mutator family [Ruminiclostridium hungatei]|uniref:Mutator family transposase n=1 Tax=Ruminiclostridium hungatei TaxID=48256 RepID=A0A1V4SDF2_RUMHU|nr:transposase, mutator family [Ruminiclostridium hungatei]
MAKKKIAMTEGKRNIIASLLQEYDIKTAEDIQEALKDLLGGTIQNMLEAELDNHLGYEPYERSENTNSRNGKKQKSIKSSYGEMEIDVPQDRESSFDPQLDGRIEISNNRAENAIRPYVTGRKNWLFADTTRGAKASAIVAL